LSCGRAESVFHRYRGNLGLSRGSTDRNLLESITLILLAMTPEEVRRIQQLPALIEKEIDSEKLKKMASELENILRGQLEEIRSRQISPEQTSTR